MKEIEAYLKTILEEYPKLTSFRSTIYVLEFTLFFVVTYLWLEFAEMGGHYQIIFPISLSFSVVACHYFFVEVGGLIIEKIWKQYQINIGTFWLISFAGIAFAYIVPNILGLCPFLCEVTNSYCPVMWHDVPPEVAATFVRTALMPWVLSTFIITFGEIKRQTSRELIALKEINQKLTEQQEEKNKERSIVDSDEKSTTNSYTSQGVFSFSDRDISLDIPLNDIRYIAVEDHYCRLVVGKNGEISEELIRLSLKDAISQLPGDYFTQIHRSYVVNLNHVRKVKKEGQAYKLFIDGNNDFLPASRHRAQVFLPKLKQLLK